MIKEYATFVRDEKPSDAVVDACVAGATIKVEPYEIVAYKGLAEQLGGFGGLAAHRNVA